MDHRSYDKYIFQILEHGSLTKAAASLGISQPALSSGLTNLENQLGIKIFNRKAVPITLTSEGEIYYEYINKLQVMAEDFQNKLESYRKEAHSKAIIGGPVVYAQSVISNVISNLSKDHPDYTFVIKCSPLSELIELSAKGEINCFICTRDELPVNFEKKLIKQEKIHLCIPKENPLNEQLGECISKGDFDYSLLDGQEIIFMEDGQPLNKQMNDFFQKYGIIPKNRITVDQVSIALNLAIRGQGICFASEDAMEACDLSDICVYSLPDSIFHRSIYVAYDKELFMPAACEEFIRCLINE